MLFKLVLAPVALLYLLHVWSSSSGSMMSVVVVAVGFGALVRYLVGGGIAFRLTLAGAAILVIALLAGGTATAARHNVVMPLVLLAAVLIMAWPKGLTVALLVLGGLVVLGFLSLSGGATVGSGAGGSDRTYVALGDSFSAGEGAGRYDADTATHGNRCHRSELAWPRLLGAPTDQHVACSGATSDRYASGWKPSQRKETASQRERLRALDADAIRTVTLTFGGNDLGFSSIIAACRSIGCPDLATGRTARARAKLTALYRTVLDDAPNATLYVVGYPDLVPKPGTRPVKCGWLQPYDRNLRRLLRTEDALEEMLEAAVDDVGDPRVRYVSVRDALAGHELCTRDSWVYPVTPLRGPSPNNKQQGHPRRCGQIALANAVAAGVASHGGPPMRVPDACR
jgi:lysophospholipase L1-like esterase